MPSVLSKMAPKCFRPDMDDLNMGPVLSSGRLSGVGTFETPTWCRDADLTQPENQRRLEAHVSSVFGRPMFMIISPVGNAHQFLFTTDPHSACDPCDPSMLGLQREARRARRRAERLLSPITKATCWSCSRILDKKLRKCSKCDTARYCSVPCQQRHWATHKLKCH